MESIRLVCHCGGPMEKVDTVWREFPVRGWRCLECGDEALHPGDAQRAFELARAGEARAEARNRTAIS